MIAVLFLLVALVTVAICASTRLHVLVLAFFCSLAFTQTAGVGADLPVQLPSVRPSVTAVMSINDTTYDIDDAVGMDGEQVGSSLELFYPASIVQDEEFSLYINRIAANSDVLFALTNPEGAVEVGRESASFLGNARITRRLSQVGTWRLDVHYAGQAQTVWVEVRSRTPQGNGNEDNAEVIQFSLEQGVLQASGAVTWRLAFPEGSGSSHSFIRETNAEGDYIYLAHGNSLLQIAAETGIITQRWLLPNAVLELRSAGAGGIIVRVSLDGQERALLIERGRLTEALPFADEAQLFTWLDNEAKVTDIRHRLEQDQSQPWLYARQASQQGTDAAEKEALLTTALAQAQGFYTLAALSTLAYQQGFETLAVRAFDAAMEDFLARGYDPRLLRHLDYVRRYHFPFDALQAALEQEDLQASRFFAERLWWSAPNLMEAKALYSRYSQLLTQAGRQDQARLWSARAEPALGSTTILPSTLAPTESIGEGVGYPRRLWASWGRPLLVTLSQTGWGMVLALLASFLLLCLVLSQKYQAMQVNQGGWGLRFWHFFERLNGVFLLLLLAGLLFLLPWGQQMHSLPAGLQSGRWAQDVLATLPLDRMALEEISRVAGERGHHSANQDVLAYAERYGVTVRPIATLEDIQQQLSKGIANNWQGFRVAPLASVDALAPRSLANVKAEPWLWRALCLLYGLVLLLFIISLFVPRAKGSAHSARPWHFYILALLVAGTGLCNMLWGGALLLVWTLLIYEAVAQWVAQSTWINVQLPSMGLSPVRLRTAFIVVYAINLLMLWLEAGLHQRVRRKVTRPLLAGTGRNASTIPKAQEPAEMLPSGNYHVLRADEPQPWE